MPAAKRRKQGAARQHTRKTRAPTHAQTSAPARTQESLSAQATRLEEQLLAAAARAASIAAARGAEAAGLRRDVATLIEQHRSTVNLHLQL